MACYEDLRALYAATAKERDELRKENEQMKEICDSLPDDAWARKIMMIDNWNEWDEGHFVAPSHKFGYKYLQAVREVFTKRDNLPDYRLPETLGLGPYDKNIDLEAEIK